MQACCGRAPYIFGEVRDRNVVVRLRVVSEGADVHSFFEFSYLRAAGPKIAVLAESSLLLASSCLVKDNPADGHTNIMAVTFLGKYSAVAIS